MGQAATKGRNRPDVSAETRQRTFGLSKRMLRKLADCSRFARLRFPRFFECASFRILASRLALTSVCAELDLPSVALGYFGASAIVRVKSLPTGGKPGRRNWRLVA